MSAAVYTVLNKAYALANSDSVSVDENYKSMKQFILNDESLTENEKLEAKELLKKEYDYTKILYDEGKRRVCKNCQQKCLAKLYCEYCIRNYLKSKFSSWTSENNGINNLIQECQMDSRAPDSIIEWIPYNNLQDIKYLTEGGFSEIYKADWIGGRYHEWDSKEQQLKRCGSMEIILKKLVNIERADRIWFDEAKSHLTISNKWPDIVKCYGLTRNPLDGKYMLVMMKLDMDLKDYLRQYHDQLSWNEKITIAYHVINALDSIHKENVVHRDLHSGNILYNQSSNYWLISDLGFCGPVDKPLGGIYGNLPYIAPEAIVGKEYSFASDIYSIAMIMWEISSGQPPFANYKKDYNLAMNIVNGKRPTIVSETPLKYVELMKQCWDADPKKRPDIKMLSDMINDINRLYYPNVPTSYNKKNIFRKFLRKFKKTNANNLNNVSTSEIMSCYNAGHASKIYNLNNLPEPKNATEEEQEAFHSKPYSFSIPENIDDFNKSNDKNNNTSKSNSIFKGNSKALSKVLQKLNIGPSNNNQNYHERSIINQQVKNQDVDDNDEICNNPNLHPEEQEEFEIPNDGF